MALFLVYSIVWPFFDAAYCMAYLGTVCLMASFASVATMVVMVVWWVVVVEFAVSEVWRGSLAVVLAASVWV